MRLTNALRWILDRIALPLLVMSAAMLHVYTTYTAFNLTSGMLWRWVAAVAAWCTPPIAQFVVAYYAWRATGSWVNSYSFWLLAWIAWLIGVLLLVRIVRRLNRPALEQAAP